MKKTFTLFALLLMTLAAVAQNYKTLENIPYHTGTGNAYADERCKLDFYYPTDKENFPVAVFFHGGGLTGGEKYLPAELLESGIGIVTVNYRLLPKAELPDIIDDAAAAVAWTFKNIGQYGGNVQRIYVSGHSAGGYLTDMIGLDKKCIGPLQILHRVIRIDPEVCTYTGLLAAAAHRVCYRLRCVVGHGKGVNRQISDLHIFIRSDLPEQIGRNFSE